MKKTPFILIMLTMVFFAGINMECKSKKYALGDDDIIYVFADSADWAIYKDSFNEIFGKYIRTPLMEQECTLVWKPFEQFEQHTQFKNIFIIGRLDAQDPVSKNIQNLLNKEVIAGIENGKFFYIPKPDAYAYKQYLMFFVALSIDDMIQKIGDLGELAYQDFRKFYFKRLSDQMFARMEQKDLQKYIEKYFPFSIRVQHDYFIADENLEDNYVWIRRIAPDRSILVHWLPLSANFELTSRWVIDERNRLAEDIYFDDVIVEDETKAYAIKFKNWNAIRLEGTWKNDSLVLGGPFRNISFIDTVTQRIFMIDYYVQAIGKRKIPYLNQLNVIAYTFRALEKPKVAEGDSL